jgi:adenine-specific DNA-methyltransferase
LTQDAHSWAGQLGMTATPLFGREMPNGDCHRALLDGIQASFLLSDEGVDDQIASAPDWAWSANVRHHIYLNRERIHLSRSIGTRDVFDRASVEARLPEFLRYLEADNAAPTTGAIDHIVRTFRKHRAALEGMKSENSSLASFLYLLALTQEENNATDAYDNIIEKYSLEPFDSNLIDKDYTARFIEEIRSSSAIPRKLCLPVTIRLAGGVLFQETHAELLLGPTQLSFWGLSEPFTQKLDLSHGAYYTPPGLARMLAEVAIETHLVRPEITIADPACGSGIFLCEVIRALQRRNYTGRINVIGHDISPPAIQMARFAAACAVHDYPLAVVNLSISVADFLSSAPIDPVPNIILMNPPFQAWESLSLPLKDIVKKTLGMTLAGRPDLSSAFIQKALDEISDGGTLATLLPRGVLDSQSGAIWRSRIQSESSVRLLATMGEHGLFRHAMVSVGAMVLDKGGGSSPTAMVWADERGNSGDAALRALRRRLWSASVEDRSDNWAIYSIRPEELSVRKSWLPTPNALGSLVEVIKNLNIPRVKDLFRVRQGIKTGLNEALLISEIELNKLPRREQKYFKLTAGGGDISKGEIHSSQYIFYVPDIFSTPEQLIAEVPTFGKRLRSFKERLQRRPKSNPQIWWEPIWPRKDIGTKPRILTKMFGGLEMAAVDFAGEFLPLQAYAWLPNVEKIAVDKELHEAALWWYCRILNSRIFFLLRREWAAAITSGGQLDVSPKYVNEIPLPTPSEGDLVHIVSLGRKIDVTATRANEEIVAGLYNTDLTSWPIDYDRNY